MATATLLVPLPGPLLPPIVRGMRDNHSSPPQAKDPTLTAKSKKDLSVVLAPPNRADTATEERRTGARPRTAATRARAGCAATRAEEVEQRRACILLNVCGGEEVCGVIGVEVVALGAVIGAIDSDQWRWLAAALEWRGTSVPHATGQG